MSFEKWQFVKVVCSAFISIAEYVDLIGFVRAVRHTGIVEVDFRKSIDNARADSIIVASAGRFSEKTYRQDLERINIFKPAELVAEYIGPKEKADILFGYGNWHHLETLVAPLDKNSLCAKDGCSRNVEVRAMVDFWGMVSEIDLCDACADEWFGARADSFPFRRNLPLPEKSAVGNKIPLAILAING